VVLVSINNLSVSFGGPYILEGASLQISSGERIGLLGRNGSGKSTLLRILNREIQADSGGIIVNQGVKTAMLSQEVPDELPGTVYDVVASGGSSHIDLLLQYHELTMRMSGQACDDGLLKRLEQVQHRLETTGAWNFHRKIQSVTALAGLDENAAFKTLSAGLKRRVFLAKALVDDPDILLLDEPTNHLDIGSILWLEGFLSSYEKTVIFVTHDRSFLQNLSTRITEIDRGKLVSYPCDYASYLKRRSSMLSAEEKNRQTFDKKLAGEEAWVRKGVKARRTRNEGRVRALVEMREQLRLRRDQTANAKIIIQEAQKSGRLVADARDICFAYGDKTIIKDFSTTILRGDKVGIIGPNGSGKTTMLRVLLGELEPQQGKVRIGTRTNIAYFDQIRARLDEELSVKENVAGKNDHVFVGETSRHVVGYLKDFLFPQSQIMAPVRNLSGGERNRLLLAKLFCTPSNILVLDEPTNDLDAETLEMLEDRLVEYSGTVIMVSHDRTFLNNVVTSTIVFEGDACINEYVGGYDDWIRQRPVIEEEKAPERPKRQRPKKEKTKLSYKESRELDELPQRIEDIENKIGSLFKTLNNPQYHVDNDADTVLEANTRMESLERQLDEAYNRWNELEELAARFSPNTRPC